MSAHAEIVAALSTTDAFPEGGPVERRETHVSHVFLTRTHAWKLLKSVRFDFLDFSTPAARQTECRNEIRLNRRLAPDVYLDVVPITDEDGRPQVGGEGVPLDWLIRMRRLPDDATLEARIERGVARTTDIDRILDALCPFFAAAPHDARIAADGRPEVVHRHAAENFAVLNKSAKAEAAAELLEKSVARLRSAQLQFLATRADLLEQRLSEGHVRDGHGDLKAEHCYFPEDDLADERTGSDASGVAIIDCIAFNEHLRHVDTLDEICFLAVELARLGRADLALHLHAEYRRRTGDDAPEELARFYESYRLAVRAKVACLRANEQSVEDRRDSLRAAAECVSEAFACLEPHHSPRLIVIFGLSGTGKSTIAKTLAERIGAVRYSSDAIRKKIHDQSIEERGGAELYTAQADARTYAALLERGHASLRAGVTVILDATFRHRGDREAVLRMASAAGVSPLFVECSCAPEVARARLVERKRLGRDASDADVKIYESQRENTDPPREIAEENRLSVDTDRSVDDSLAQIVRRLAVV